MGYFSEKRNRRRKVALTYIGFASSTRMSIVLRSLLSVSDLSVQLQDDFIPILSNWKHRLGRCLEVFVIVAVM